MKDHQIKKRVAYLLLFCGISLVFAFVFLKFYKRSYVQTKILMGTFVNVEICSHTIPGFKTKGVFESLWQRAEDLTLKMNAYDDRSDIARLNTSLKNESVVSPEVYGLIQEALRLNALTQGAFNIAVGPMVELWQEAAHQQKIPSPEEILRVKKKTDNQNIILHKSNRVEFLVKDMALDLSAIAKGYIVDEIVKIIRDAGYDDFFVDAGGDIYVSGRNCKGNPWRIGIRDPLDKKEIFDILNLSNTAVTTSGGYENYFEIAGKRYPHVLDPRTGFPEKGIVSATVIAPTTKEADALSTALCVLEPLEGIALIESLGQAYQALLVQRDDGETRVFETKDFKNNR